ncbi:MAG: hypothetical protein M3235_00630, partial [Actinomycetota bacterium]|nr:hypothetical protein [Actinomycetota bacterium]
LRHRGRPADDAVVTVVGADGRQLGRGRADPSGTYTIALADAGTPHLLVVRWRGHPHAEPLGRARSQARDVELPDHRHAAGRDIDGPARPPVA